MNLKTVCGWMLPTLFVALIASPCAEAASSGSSAREAFFRCKDASGQTHYGDSMPPACNGLDTEVLNERGTVLRVIEGTRSLAARAERQAAEDALKTQRDAAALRDRMLVESYLSVQEIERLRDQRIGLLQTQLRISEQNIATLKEREQRLLQQAQRFRPYNDKPQAPPLPDHVAEEMVNTVNGIAVAEQNIADKRAEQQRLETQFGEDIKRFRELKGIK